MILPPMILPDLRFFSFHPVNPVYPVRTLFSSLLSRLFAYFAVNTNSVRHGCCLPYEVLLCAPLSKTEAARMTIHEDP